MLPRPSSRSIANPGSLSGSSRSGSDGGAPRPAAAVRAPADPARPGIRGRRDVVLERGEGLVLQGVETQAGQRRGGRAGDMVDPLQRGEFGRRTAIGDVTPASTSGARRGDPGSSLRFRRRAEQRGEPPLPLGAEHPVNALVAGVDGRVRFAQDLGGFADRPVLDGDHPVGQPGLRVHPGADGRLRLLGLPDQDRRVVRAARSGPFRRVAVGRGGSASRFPPGPRTRRPTPPDGAAAGRSPGSGTASRATCGTPGSGRSGTSASAPSARPRSAGRAHRRRRRPAHSGRTIAAASGRIAHGTPPRPDDRPSRAPGPAGSGWSSRRRAPGRRLPVRTGRRPVGAHPQARD